MALIRRIEGPDATWHRLCDDPDNGKPVRFLIEALDERTDREISRRHFGRRPAFRVKRNGDRVPTVDNDALDAYVIDAAVRCLKDCENFSAFIGSNSAAEAYTKALARPVSTGDAVVFDGCLTDGVKRHVLTEEPSLAGWILNKAHEARVIARAAAEEQEEGKDET